ncbi:MAG: helix-turn-helix domain-containing protein [Clostridium sp.]
MYNIGERIKRLRKERGLTQSDISGDILNRVVLSRVENNLQDPTLGQLLHIAKKMDIDLVELFRNGSFDFRNNNEFFDKIAVMYNNKHYYDIVKFYDLYKKEFSKIQNKNKFFYLGIAYYENKIYEEAEKFLKKYVTYFLKEEEEVQQKIVLDFCLALNTLCKISFIKGKNINVAMHYLDVGNKFITKFHVENSYIGLAFLSNTCHLYLQSMRYKKIINTCRYFETTKMEICYPQIFVNIHKSLAVAYSNIGDYDKSIENTKKVIGLYEFLGDHNKRGIAYTNYINALRFSGDFKEALRIARYCKEEFKGEHGIINDILVNEMIVYYNMNDFRNVENVSKKIKIGNLNKDFLADYNFVMGSFLMNKGKKELAIKNFKKCEVFFKREGYNYDLYMLYEYLYELTNECKYIILKENLNISRTSKNIVLEL